MIERWPESKISKQRSYSTVRLDVLVGWTSGLLTSLWPSVAVVSETQRMFTHPACQLDNDTFHELAVAETVRALIENQTISPAFVERIVREHGCGAIGRAYLIHGFQQKTHLAWLRRRFKGKFYRTRYPAIAFSQGIAAEDPVIASVESSRQGVASLRSWAGN